jgi:hypothetical protein
MYYLTNSEYRDPSRDTPQDTQRIIIEYNNRIFNREWRSQCTYIDPKWVKFGAISKEANFKKIIQFINQYSGYTGMNHQTNPNGGNNAYIKSGSDTASARRQHLLDLVL